MKQLYICDKCGAQFDNFDDAWNCENGHLNGFDSSMDEELRKRWRYRPGQVMPERIVMATSKWNYDTNPEGEVIYSFFSYKLDKPLPEQESAEILAEYAKRKEQENAYWEEYRARKERERAEREAQESA